MTHPKVEGMYRIKKEGKDLDVEGGRSCALLIVSETMLLLLFPVLWKFQNFVILCSKLVIFGIIPFKRPIVGGPSVFEVEDMRH